MQENEHQNPEALAQEQNAQATPETLETPPSAEPPKRRRGRPPKNPALQEQTVNPGAEQKRGPGRPKKQAGPQFSAEDVTKLARQIQGLHVIAAQATGLGELVISETESVMLADSLTKVSEEYGLSLSGKTGAMLQLLGTAAIVYMPRFASINQKMKAKKASEATIIENGQPT